MTRKGNFTGTGYFGTGNMVERCVRKVGKLTVGSWVQERKLLPCCALVNAVLLYSTLQPRFSLSSRDGARRDGEVSQAPQSCDFRSSLLQAADTQVISDYVRYFLHQHTILLGQPATVEVVANLIRLLSYQNKNMLQAGVIVGGWDKYEGGQIYSVPWLGALVGSGHQFTSLKATSQAPLLSV
ncbi:Proteasome subunit beta type-6 [Carex littledalei]|uniref:Proteasome subunit beta type-6 n=1 Tax=Carex littledalei TaxID=544730 RepID=A0A833W020_9POAL|nr:Proteasome subunit beta type-6 [Carex littledalei]